MKSPKKIKNGLEYLGMTLVADKERYIRKHGIAYAYAEDLAKDALEYIQQLEAQQPRWINVKERLPEDDGYVLCHCNDGSSDIVCMYHGDGDFVTPDLDCYTGIVTHWMPLPQPPEEE